MALPAAGPEASVQLRWGECERDPLGVAGMPTPARSVAALANWKRKSLRGYKRLAPAHAVSRPPAENLGAQMHERAKETVSGYHLHAPVSAAREN